MTLKRNFPINIPFDSSLWPCPWTYIYYQLVMLHTCAVIWKSKGGYDHDLARIRDRYSRKREEKTKNADSHNIIKLEQPNQLESIITTLQNI